MQVSELISFFGGTTKTAKALGTSRQNVHNWKKSGQVPLKWQFEAEFITDSALIVSRPLRSVNEHDQAKSA